MSALQCLIVLMSTFSKSPIGHQVGVEIRRVHRTRSEQSAGRQGRHQLSPQVSYLHRSFSNKMSFDLWRMLPVGRSTTAREPIDSTIPQRMRFRRALPSKVRVNRGQAEFFYSSPACTYWLQNRGTRCHSYRAPAATIAFDNAYFTVRATRSPRSSRRPVRPFRSPRLASKLVADIVGQEFHVTIGIQEM